MKVKFEVWDCSSIKADGSFNDFHSFICEKWEELGTIDIPYTPSEGMYLYTLDWLKLLNTKLTPDEIIQIEGDLEIYQFHIAMIVAYPDYLLLRIATDPGNYDN